MDNIDTSHDEAMIRELIATWMEASKSGDIETVLRLMTDDVVFMVPGQEPFGKDAFATASYQQRTMQIDGKSEIKEMKIIGDWAYVRNFISLQINMSDGEIIHRSGYTLTLFIKEHDGKWRLARDANLLTVDVL